MRISSRPQSAEEIPAEAPAAASTAPRSSWSQRRASFRDERNLDDLWHLIEGSTDDLRGVERRAVVNRSCYACVKNQYQITARLAQGLTAPIHAHQWVSARAGTCAVTPAFSAGQSPENDCVHHLIHALDSGEGIFQFISPGSHRTGRSSHGKSIIQMLHDLRATSPGANLPIAERYEITDFELIEGSHEHGDCAQYCATARDVNTGHVRHIPLTQVGLQFDGRVLQGEEIRRANTLLENHKRRATEMRTADEAAGVPTKDYPVSRYGPLILSHVGIGRNAALITFNDIRSRIQDENTVVTKKNLDQMLLDVIGNGREARGPRFLHSKEQLRVVRHMLLELIDERDQRDKMNRAGRVALAGRAMQRLVTRGVRSNVPAARARAEGSQSTQSSQHIAVPAAVQVPLRPPDRIPPVQNPGASASRQPVAAASNPPAESVAAGSNAQRRLGTHPVRPGNRDASTAANATNNNGAALSPAPANQPVAASPSPRRATRNIPSGVSHCIHHENTANAHTIYTFDMTRLNMDTVDRSLHGDTHHIKGISGANNDCWWRAGWISILLQHAHSPHAADNLERLIVASIGETFRVDAKVITSMIESMRKNGLYSVIVQGRPGPDQDEISAQCGLRPPGSRAKSGEKDEDVFRRLSVALLAKAGVDTRAVERAVHGNAAADENMLAGLFQQLKTDMVIFTKVRRPPMSSVTLLSFDESSLDDLVFDDTEKGIFTDTFINRIPGLPIIVTGGQHYDLAIPGAMLRRGFSG